jgi:hypothetical protein
MKKLIPLSLLCLLAAAAAARAQQPPANISPQMHSNLAAAQQNCQAAWEKLAEAQKANEWDMNGNAERAKDLLTQAAEELKAAAQTANADAGSQQPRRSEPAGRGPEVDISAGKHPYLAASQQLTFQAWQDIVKAQAAQDWNMGGHAEKAKDLLNQAAKSMKAAALAANPR